METGQEVNADKSMYMVMSQDQNAGCHRLISSFERVEEFKYLRITLRNQDSIQKEIKSRLKLGQVQYILSSTLLSKNLKIKIYKIIFLPVVIMGVKLGSSH